MPASYENALMTRFRWAVAGVVLVIALMGAGIGFLMPGLQAEQARLLGETVPRSLTAAEIGVGLERLGLEAERMALAGDPAEVEVSGEKLGARIGEISAEMGTAFPLDWQRDLMVREVASLEAAAGRLGSAVSARLDAVARREALLSRVSLMNMQDLGWLEARLTEASRSVARSNAELAVLGQLAELRTLAHRINEQLRWAGVSGEGRELDWVQADLEQSFGRTEEIVSRLPAGSRGNVAESFAELRELSLGDTGLLAERAAERQAAEEVSVAARELDRAVQRIASLSGQFIGEATRELASVAAHSNRSLAIWGIAGAALALIAVIVIGFGFGRMLNRTERSLGTVTEAMIALSGASAQQTDWDEMGRLARAVKTAAAKVALLEERGTASARLNAALLQELRAPLGEVAELAGQLRQSSKMIGTNGQKLTRISTQARHMIALLTGGEECPEAVGSDPEIEEIDFKPLVESIFAAQKSGKDVKFALSGKVGKIRTEETPLRQVLTVLISNAVAHHDRDKGEVLMAVEEIGDHLRIRLVDDGPGIPREIQPGLFRLQKDAKRAPGLALAHQIVSERKGRIELVSDPGKFRGAAFVVTWPLGNRRSAKVLKLRSRAAA